MKYRVGNAVHDENGKSRGGKKGDQLQKKTPDTSGEVKIQDFYMNKKGWNVLRLKNATYAIAAASLMRLACDNKNVGYSQSDREAIYKDGVTSDKPTNCDCSSLVCEILREVTPKKIPDFYTGNEVEVLEKTGLFEKAFEFVAGETTLYVGDVLVTKTKGHTLIIVEGMPRTNPFAIPNTAVTSAANAKNHKLKNYISKGEGVQWVQYQLCMRGYQKEIDACGGIDGVCGKGTVEIIELFQIKVELEVDGICGIMTRQALK